MKVAKDRMVRPFLKWAGGKRQLLPEIRKCIPANFNTYFEPFVGAGAVLFDLQPERAVINDINNELINVYKVIRDGVEWLIDDLKQHHNEKDYFYSIRDLDRTDDYHKWQPAKKASRILYLNKTCYNGLFRVNKKGYFNVPFGNYRAPQIVNEKTLRAVHRYLNDNDVSLMRTDFESAVAQAGKGDFVYFDPPYDPVSETASFTGYSLDGFNRDDQLRLRDVFIELDKRGCKVLLSNSATDFIKEIYRQFPIRLVSAGRNINSVATRRGKIAEVLVMNYEPPIKE
ncbi:DNA adenine methylase [Terrilactibacillus sp. S3-3]|nr:DNA adenine methylase [Terrilactibacillus sp. S3-3]